MHIEQSPLGKHADATTSTPPISKKKATGYEGIIFGLLLSLTFIAFLNMLIHLL
jgi:hypothetical protein